MPSIALHHPVHTLGNELLLPAGTVLTEENIESFMSSKKAPPMQTHSLLSYGSIQADMQKFIQSQPYHAIFTEKEHIARIMTIMKSVHLALPILQSLDYFKQHDFYTYKHFLMVFALSTLLSNDLVPDAQHRLDLAEAGPTHDIGKICVPIEILKKNTPLSRHELSVLEHHSAAGYVLLSYYCNDTRNLAVTVARDHHERKDGSGYPRGIALNDLMVEIIAVSDVYDALISPRPYRQTSYDNRTALEEITARAEAGTFSWNIVKALIAHNRKSRPHYSDTNVSSKKRGTPPPDNVYGIIEKDEETSH